MMLYILAKKKRDFLHFSRKKELELLRNRKPFLNLLRLRRFRYYPGLKPLKSLLKIQLIIFRSICSHWHVFVCLVLISVQMRAKRSFQSKVTSRPGSSPSCSQQVSEPYSGNIYPFTVGCSLCWLGMETKGLTVLTE